MPETVESQKESVTINSSETVATAAMKMQTNKVACLICMGTSLVFFGLAMVVMELENLFAGKLEELIVGLVVVTILLISGFLLIRSGHQCHLETKYT